MRSDVKVSQSVSTNRRGQGFGNLNMIVLRGGREKRETEWQEEEDANGRL